MWNIKNVKFHNAGSPRAPAATASSLFRLYDTNAAFVLVTVQSVRQTLVETRRCPQGVSPSTRACKQGQEDLFRISCRARPLNSLKSHYNKIPSKLLLVGFVPRLLSRTGESLCRRCTCLRTKATGESFTSSSGKRREKPERTRRKQGPARDACPGKPDRLVGKIPRRYYASRAATHPARQE